ncbi:hypothetical protein [Actinoplanes palleronii]|uniref:Uncharacterized protein n=1 Tax=Actinoplanes palleronii TaxID=113570 RepID=A0ABQ4BM30_9ACTN|nr:hypothetical protein [Actinoplanes palleronii]GIE71731.1 hypothetical protein Apa02nite_078390 [Actinoplanes palleronii]
MAVVLFPRARAGMGNRLGLRVAEAAAVLVPIIVGLVAQTYVYLHFRPMTGGAHTAHRIEQIAAVFLLPAIIAVPVTGIRRKRRVTTRP